MPYGRPPSDIPRCAATDCGNIIEPYGDERDAALSPKERVLCNDCGKKSQELATTGGARIGDVVVQASIGSVATYDFPAGMYGNISK